MNSGPLEGKATILPPFPDPVLVAPGELPIDIPLDFLEPPITITGNLQTTLVYYINKENVYADLYAFILIMVTFL